jgi:hypothetical protein
MVEPTNWWYYFKKTEQGNGARCLPVVEISSVFPGLLLDDNKLVVPNISSAAWRYNTNTKPSNNNQFLYIPICKTIILNYNVQNTTKNLLLCIEKENK